MAVFMFHRDLRVVDNTALLTACEWASAHGGGVLPVFIFSPEQIDPLRNTYYSAAAVQFMCESLGELTGLRVFHGDTLEVLEGLYKKGMKAVFFNKDYSVYARERDEKIRRWCDKHSVEFHGDIEDYDLIPHAEGLLEQPVRPYTNLSQYFARFVKSVAGRPVLNVRKPAAAATLPKSTIKAGEALCAKTLPPYRVNASLAQRGGRTNGRKVIERIRRGDLAKYARDRDYPAIDGTTQASAHLHFGTISVREMYWALRDKKNDALIRELVFRSFYLKIYSMRPALQRGEAFNSSLDKAVPWKSPKAAPREWKIWTAGTTGFPLVDAGMRQLEGTGWMHNRVRMLVATTATRYLLLDWRDCAKHFYTRLVDADTFSNTAGWQWAAGIGPDAVPYFRAPMNPFIQSKKFDFNAEYIKKWIPELAAVTPADIHKWDDEKTRKKYPGCTYPAPIIEQKVASRRAVTTFKQAAAAASKTSAISV
jgi:deoxyribodipyrimidine photo-lyase